VGPSDETLLVYGPDVARRLADNSRLTGKRELDQAREAVTKPVIDASVPRALRDWRVLSSISADLLDPSPGMRFLGLKAIANALRIKRDRAPLSPERLRKLWRDHPNVRQWLLRVDPKTGDRMDDPADVRRGYFVTDASRLSELFFWLIEHNTEVKKKATAGLERDQNRRWRARDAE
jgi:hypothetical protein